MTGVGLGIFKAAHSRQSCNPASKKITDLLTHFVRPNPGSEKAAGGFGGCELDPQPPPESVAQPSLGQQIGGTGEAYGMY